MLSLRKDIVYRQCCRMFIGQIKQLVAKSPRAFLFRLLSSGESSSTRTMAHDHVQTTDISADGSAQERTRLFQWNRQSLHVAPVKVMPGSSPQCATVLHPGPALEMVDSYGNPSLVCLLKVASVSRMYAMHSPVDESGRTFFDYGKLTDKCFTFFSTTCVNIARAMYDPQVSKWPLEIEMRPGHIGRTSLSTVSAIFSSEHREAGKLMSQTSQVVLVDKATRRPTPVSDEWRQLYLPHCVNGDKPLILDRQQVPPDGAESVYQMKVAWSDTDTYNHTNFSSYPRFAVDAVHDALRQGLLSGSLSEKDLAAGVAEVKVSYIGEAVEGDVLHVHVWCPKGSERTVICSIEKEGVIINQTTLTFYSSETACQL